MTSTEGEYISTSNSEVLKNPEGDLDNKSSSSLQNSVSSGQQQKKRSETERTNNKQQNSESMNDVLNNTQEQAGRFQNSPENNQTGGNEREHSDVTSITVPKPEMGSETWKEHVTKNLTSEDEETEQSRENNQNCDEDEYDPDLHISDEERKAFAFMLEKRKEDLIKQKEKFQNWVDSITRRRMFALSRIRKINKSHAQRMEFYDKIDNYLTSAETVISSNAQSIDSSSQSNIPHKFEDIVRENTGFVLNTSTPKEDESVNTGRDDSSKNGQVDVNSNTQSPILNESAQNVTNSVSTDGNLNINHDVEVDSNLSSKKSNNNENTPKIVPVNS